MLDSISIVKFFLLGVIGWITYKIFIWPYYVSPLRKIPGPPSDNPIFGNLQSLIKGAGFTEPQLQWFAIALIGNGLVFAEGDDHKRQRKMMNPAFTHSNIKEMVPTFIRIASTLKGLIEKEINQGNSNINLTPFISKTTLDIIGLVGFSYEFNSLTSSNELAAAYDSALNAPRSTFQTGVIMLSNYVPFIRDIPVEKMTFEELKYQIMTFLMAGHETTNVTTCWALYLLAQHPHEQDKLREELVKAFPDKSNYNPTYDEINSLEYLNCVIKETLRILPPVPVVKRVNLKDEVFGKYFIPKNSEIFFGISWSKRFQIRKRAFPLSKPEPYLGLAVSKVES
ncbi:unnamed protein product [Rhizophagus irregularis]|nr:unnamed protein product [Rhizophagus irregularis]